MYKKPGCIAETGGRLGFFSDLFFFFFLFPIRGPGRGWRCPALRSLLPGERLVPGAKKIRQPTERAGEERGGIRGEGIGVDAAEGGGVEKKRMLREKR